MAADKELMDYLRAEFAKIDRRLHVITAALDKTTLDDATATEIHLRNAQRLLDEEKQRSLDAKERQFERLKVAAQAKDKAEAELRERVAILERQVAELLRAREDA